MNKRNIVKDYILESLHSHRYSEGQIIESESQLCELLNVSRMTVRQAIDELVAQGIVYKEKGRGTFIMKQPKYAKFQCGISFSEEVRKNGMIPSSKEASIKLIEANDYISKYLNINKGEKVWEVKRIRLANNIPVSYVQEYYLYSICPDLNQDIIEHSIFKHLADHNITYKFIDQQLEAIPCPSYLASKLEVEENYPLIKMTLVAYLKNGIPYHFGTSYYKTDRIKLTQSYYNKNN